MDSHLQAVLCLLTHCVCVAGEGGQAEAAPAAPRLVGIAPMFRAICQLQGGATPLWACYIACLLHSRFT